MRILGIETSCDETSVAILEGDGTVRSNLIASQIERHRPFGGVVPEIASREHLQHLMPLIDQSLDEAGVALSEVSAIAVTSGPGLIGALLVGLSAAQGLAYGLRIPLVAVNHLEGHIDSPYLQLSGPAIPMPDRFLSLVVSGGHSSVYDVRASEGARMINRTRDDAAGEVFDKVAKFIGLPYPGGPQIEARGRDGDPARYDFPLARFKDGSVDFSFSGLKSNSIRLARREGLTPPIESMDRETLVRLAGFCASFQKAVVDQILDRLETIWRSLDSARRPGELAVAGGVAANTELRERATSWCAEAGLSIRLPERRYCTDNAAMIAFAGLRRLGNVSGDPLRVKARSRMAVGG
ncbi:MAG TPA: tRNA (adenosine(37)-N6)-threonylcarbamoyltransferase complex transferase subunit TsaD [Thermoanaerobaculia bacterium]|nr:tRNA (adenosine(37)-N6)-threonylcarbamoyltransferase complex transferase subunit TsaD [Thermoanaerobaculia bacterium]